MKKVRGISASLAVVVLTAGLALAHQESPDPARSGATSAGPGARTMQGAKAQADASGHGGAMEGCMGGRKGRGGMMGGGMMSGGMMGGGMMGGAAPNSQWRGASTP